MDSFLAVRDDLSKLINDQATVLYLKLQKLEVDQLGMPDHCLHYFKSSHFSRIFFSIQTSAELLYRAIRLVGKKPSELVVMDYGAGVGTLYSLAKLIGCGKVIYNDHLEDWKKSAQLLARALNCDSDLYIVGDIGKTLRHLSDQHIHCDIIASRNVIEHIYDLRSFFKQVAERQPDAVIYSSTTANWKNPGTQFTHRKMHVKWEKVYLERRKEIIKQFAPDLSISVVDKLAAGTRGLAKWDIKNAVEQYQLSGQFPVQLTIGTNTCDPENGVWVEHLIPLEKYREWIEDAGYSAAFGAGFWDTHNRTSWKNLVGLISNPLIKNIPGLAYLLAPFIYVIAKPLKNSQSRLSSQG